MISDVTGILLAGGKSRRMGQDKKVLSVGEGTLLDRSLDTLRSLFDQVEIVIAQDSPLLDAPVIISRDLLPGCGSLGGIFTGIKNAKTSHVFVAACDMPFLNPAVIQYLVRQKEEADIVVVRTELGLQMTHALYGKRCMPVIEEMIQGARLRIQELVSSREVRVRVIERKEIEEFDPLALSFTNVNTPQELEIARRLSHSDAINDVDRTKS